MEKIFEKRSIKIDLNPKYKFLEKFVTSMPDLFSREGEVIYTGRNLIKVLESDGVPVNVKRYRTPNFFNRVVYSFIRPSKGIRAFTYPQRLLELGFETPEPIAYIEERRFGLIGLSYFLSIQSSYRFTFYQFGNADIHDCRDIIVEFARFTARLHDAGVYHRDYSPGNILFDQVDGTYRFCLVDINRMSFGSVGMKQGCANFARLWGQTPLFDLLADVYAAARGFDPKECRRLILKYRRQFWVRYRRRHPVGYCLDIDKL